jgi:phosphoribosylglycinamide formyltransferase-1
VKVSGVTVHFVDGGVDTGAIILQEAVTLPPTRNEEEILTVLHRTEHELLPRAIRLFARGGVRVDPDDPRYVHIDEGVLSDHG